MCVCVGGGGVKREFERLGGGDIQGLLLCAYWQTNSMGGNAPLPQMKF